MRKEEENDRITPRKKLKEIYKKKERKRNRK